MKKCRRGAPNDRPTIGPEESRIAQGCVVARVSGPDVYTREDADDGALAYRSLKGAPRIHGDQVSAVVADGMSIDEANESGVEAWAWGKTQAGHGDVVARYSGARLTRRRMGRRRR